ncbi:hypothetical protein C6399_23020 [Bacillus licheniformis]|nr:hypothetical protein C6399_23020 [Bacillus licheniformis]
MGWIWNVRERRKRAFMPRKSIYNERYPHANCRRWPRRAVFALRGCLWEFEGAEARCQSNRGIKSGRIPGEYEKLVWGRKGTSFPTLQLFIEPFAVCAGGGTLLLGCPLARAFFVILGNVSTISPFPFNRRTNVPSFFML